MVPTHALLCESAFCRSLPVQPVKASQCRFIVIDVLLVWPWWPQIICYINEKRCCLHGNYLIICTVCFLECKTYLFNNSGSTGLVITRTIGTVSFLVFPPHICRFLLIVQGIGLTAKGGERMHHLIFLKVASSKHICVINHQSLSLVVNALHARSNWLISFLFFLRTGDR